MKSFKQLYHLPVPINKYRYYFKKRQMKRQLGEIETWTLEQTRAWQLERIRSIVDYAYQYVPYYRKQYSAVGYAIGELRTWSDFQTLPCISKNDLKENFQLLMSPDVDKLGAKICRTGGSTGKATAFYVDKDLRIREQAFFEYYWKKNGYCYGEKCVVLRGNHIVDTSRKVYSTLDRTRNFLVLDSRYASMPEILPIIDDSIRKFGAKVLQAYPSSAYMLAKIYQQAGKAAPHFDTVFLGSENTYKQQIELIERVFTPVKVLYHYGHSECAGLAIKFPYRDEMGFCPIYGVTEFLNHDGSQTRIGDIGEITATGYNLSMPLIRYRTDDFAIQSSHVSNDYMRNYQPSVVRIEGRRQEFVVTKDKRLVSLVTIGGAMHLESLGMVNDVQYEQVKPGELIIQVELPVGVEEITDSIRNAFKKDFHRVFGDSMRIELVSCHKVTRTDIGKKIYLKQHINIGNIDDYEVRT